MLTTLLLIAAITAGSLLGHFAPDAGG